MQNLQGQRAIVTGASRGLGRGIAEALVAEKVHVVAVVRDAGRLESLGRELGAEPVLADITDDDAAGRILRDVGPDLVVLCAGACPPLGSLHEQSWEGFSHNWEVDAKSTFFWLRHALLLPMKPGGHVIVDLERRRGPRVAGERRLCVGEARAVVHGRLRRERGARMKLDLRIHCLLPNLNPSTALGRAGIAAYAQRAGVSDGGVREALRSSADSRDHGKGGRRSVTRRQREVETSSPTR